MHHNFASPSPRNGRTYISSAQVTLMLYGHNHRLERIAATFQNETTMHSVPTAQADGTTVNLYNRYAGTLFSPLQ